MLTFKELIKLHGGIKVKSPNHQLYSKAITSLQLNTFYQYWTTAKKFMWPNQPWYTGTGLHYCDNLDIRPRESQVCGNHTASPLYQDTLAFSEPVNDLLHDLCGYTCVRSKITCLSSKITKGTLQRNEDWHKDESPFESLRIIIPLQTDSVYLLQLDNSEPVNLQVGLAYAFDQSKYHRVLCKGISQVDRIHLILSVVTWFNLENKKWIPNHNYNKIHPLDIFDSLTL